MDNSIIDLDILLPKNKKIRFTGKEDGQIYEIPVLIPNIFGLKYVQLVNSDKTEVEINSELVEIFLFHHNSKMDRDWINKNLSWDYISYISKVLVDEILESTKIIQGDSKGGSGKK